MNGTKKKFMTSVAVICCAASVFAFAACDKKPSGGGNGTQGGDPSGLPVGLDPYVLSVEITQNPYKTEYIVGETFSPEGLEFDSHWNVDGEEIVIDMNYSDCDGWTHRNERLTLDVTAIEFTLENFEFSVPITVEEGQADLPMEGTRLALNRDVSPNSTSTVKNNGVDYTEDVVYDHVIYSGLVEYGIGGRITDSPYPALFIRGGGLKGTESENVRTKVRYVFKNTGANPLHMRLFYDFGDAGGDIGSSKSVSLGAGEVAVSDFVVRTDKVPEKDRYGNDNNPWVKLEMLNDTSATTVAVAGYELGKIAADKFDLTLDGAEFEDGTTSALLSAGDALPQIKSKLVGEAMGYYNVLDPAEKWLDGETFAMPEHDVVLRPIATTTGYREVSVKPRKTSGGARYEINNGTNGESGKAGEVDFESEGYSDKRIKYTVYKQEADKTVISGCGNHFGNDTDYDRLFRITLTRISGDIDFTHWVDFKAAKGTVRKLTTARLTLDGEHGTATAYLIIPRGLKVNENDEAGFCMQILQEMTGDASFVFECGYARMA